MHINPKQSRALEHQLLGDDLRVLLVAFGQQIHPTREQAERYPRRARGRRLTQKMLAYEHPRTLLLTRDVGGDGYPVAAPHERERRTHKWFAYSEPRNHRWIEVRTLYRLAHFFHLGAHERAALVLKLEYERRFAASVGWHADPRPLSDLLRDRALVCERRLSVDVAALPWQLFEDDATAAGFTEAGFRDLLRSMLLADLHRVAIDSPQHAVFRAQHRTLSSFPVRGNAA